MKDKKFVQTRKIRPFRLADITRKGKNSVPVTKTGR